MVRVCPLVAISSSTNGDGRSGGYRTVDRSAGFGGGIRASAGGTGREAFTRTIARYAPDSGPSQNQAPRLSDELDPQVDVGNPAGLDDSRKGRGFRHHRIAVPRGRL